MTKHKPDPLFDVCVELCDGGGRGPITKTERGKWNKGLKELRDAGATPEQLGAAIAVYRERNRGMACNPLAIAGQWGRLLTNGQRPLAVARLRDLQSRWADVPIEDRWCIVEKLGHAPGCAPSAYELTLSQLRQALALWDKEQKP